MANEQSNIALVIGCLLSHFSSAVPSTVVKVTALSDWSASSSSGIQLEAGIYQQLYVTLVTLIKQVKQNLVFAGISRLLSD